MYKGLTPAEAFKQKTSAKTAGEATAMPGASIYEKMLQKLTQFKRHLSNIKATSAKEKVKKDEIIPEFKPYIDGVLESDAMNQDDILVHGMIWAFDAGDIDLSLKIAERVIQAEMSMPEGFERDAIDWLSESIAARTIAEFNSKEDAELDNAPFDVNAIINGKDITDIPHAKLEKAMGHVLHFKKPEQAILHYEKAHSLYNRAGTKKLADNLKKQLKTDKK